MDWFLYDNGLRHERVNMWYWRYKKYGVDYDKQVYYVLFCNL